MSDYNDLLDDDLALYAMHLLPEAETDSITRQLAGNLEATARLTEIQVQLGLFALVAVDLQEVPVGSLERLMNRVAESRTVSSAMPAAPALLESRSPSRTARVQPWIGWAIAALLAVTAGKLYQDRAAARSLLRAESGRAASLDLDFREAIKNRQDLQAETVEFNNRISQLQADLAQARGQNRAGEAKLSAQVAQMEEQRSTLQQLTQRAAVAESARSELTGTVSTQANQVQTLTQQLLSAREVMEALTDRGALRVTLTEPKQQQAPTGRATYVASRGTLIFLGSHLGQLLSSKVYELWILPVDGSSPVPVGTFKPDARGDATLVTAHLPNATAGKGFAITVENDGGSTTPTMPILLVGTAGE